MPSPLFSVQSNPPSELLLRRSDVCPTIHLPPSAWPRVVGSVTAKGCLLLLEFLPKGGLVGVGDSNPDVRRLRLPSHPATVGFAYLVLFVGLANRLATASALTRLLENIQPATFSLPTAKPRLNLPPRLLRACTWCLVASP